MRSLRLGYTGCWKVARPWGFLPLSQADFRPSLLSGYLRCRASGDGGNRGVRGGFFDVDFKSRGVGGVEVREIKAGILSPGNGIRELPQAEPTHHVLGTITPTNSTAAVTRDGIVHVFTYTGSP